MQQDRFQLHFPVRILFLPQALKDEPVWKHIIRQYFHQVGQAAG
jgi:hypothetical protein